MLCISPHAFDVLYDELIKAHPVFQNNSPNVPQTPVDYQLAVCLYRMGHFGNAASLVDVGWVAGCSEWSVEHWTYCCITAIESLHDIFVQPLTPGEKEVEKDWIDKLMGFRGLWRVDYVWWHNCCAICLTWYGGDLFRLLSWNWKWHINQQGNMLSDTLNDHLLS